jgi:DNA polymerase-3 subunit alpha
MTMRTDFVSLHTHTTYSYGDGYGQPDDYVERAMELGMPAIAFTEHGNVSSHVKLEIACQDTGIKPMYGCELYTRDEPSKHKFHLGVLAMDLSGYRNLLRLVTASWSNFYYFPTTTSKMVDRYGEGLIFLSGCLGSAMACKSMGGKDIPEHDALGIEAALKVAKSMQDRLGDRYYLELQAFPELKKTHKYNQMLIEVSHRLGIKCVVTLDAHYPRIDKQRMHAIVHAIARGGQEKKTVDQIESEWDYSVPMTLFGRQDAGKRLLATGIDKIEVIKALDHTVEVADRCTVMLPKGSPVKYPLPSGVKSAEELLWSKLREGWRYRRFKRDDNEALERLKREMTLIVDKGFADYFLMMNDVISWAKDNQIVVGPGRGSAAASLVCYLLRITEVNPMQFKQMYFERFLDPNRFDAPDIDLDFDDERRDEIRRYLVRKFGSKYVGNIGTYTTWRGKNAIDDIARVTRVPMFESSRLKEFIIERSSGDSRAGKTLIDSVTQFPLANDIIERNPSLRDAFQLEGMLKGMGVHAAGIVVAAEPLTDTVALYSRELSAQSSGGAKRKVSVLSVDKDDIKHLGMLKLDMLGLATLGMIKHCLKMTDMSLNDLYAIDIHDERVIDAFRRGDVRGIFQYEGRTTRMVNSQLKPDTFQELVDVNALSRPGPFHSGSTLDYINQKWGKWERSDDRNAWTYNEAVERICGYTKFQIIYQEQLLAICREIGGFSWADTAKVRHIIAWKYGDAAFNAYKGQFVEGAMSNGMDPKLAETIFNRMTTAGNYAFNLAHSVSYSMLGQWAMWFKQYHPDVFYAATLRKTASDKWAALMRDAMDPKYFSKRGVDGLHDDGKPVTIGNVDIDLSDVTWGRDETGHRLIPGFSQIPGIGIKLAKQICAERTIAWGDGDEWSIRDVAAVRGIGPKKLELIEGWANAKDPFNVNRLHGLLEEVRGLLRNGQLIDVHGTMLPSATHRAEELPFDLGVQFIDGSGNATWGQDRGMPVVWIGRVHGRNLRDLFEEHRTREGEELDPTTIRDPDKKHSMMLYAYDDTDEVNVRINRYKFSGFKDLLMKVRLDYDLLVVRGYKNRSFGRKIEVDDMWVIDPE